MNNLEILKNACDRLSRYYEAIGDVQKSYDYYKQQTELEKQISEAQSKQHIQDLMAKYESDRKDAELELKNTQLEKNKAEIDKNKAERQRMITITIASIAFVIATLIAAALLLKKNKII